MDGRRKALLLKQPRFSKTQLHRLFDRLQVLFAAGLPLHSAVQFIADQDTGAVSRVMDDISQRINSGSSLSQAFAAHPHSFPTLVPGMLSVAEKSGSLDSALKRLSDYFQQANRLQSQLLSGLAYPAGILLAALGMVGVLVFIVFPREQEVLRDMGRNMPFVSLLAVHSVQLGVLALGAGVLALLATYAYAERQAAEGNRELRRRWDQAVLKLPLLGRVLERAAAARMLNMLSSMLDIGVMLTQTEQIGSLAQNESIARRYRGFLQAMRTGATIDEALLTHRPFPAMAEQMFMLGYEHGQLGQALGNAAQMLESEVEHQLATFVALLEPIAMLLVGSVVGILVIATALPTLSLLQGL